MNTGIGQWKYCIPQPFSRCLFSLCSSLFDFNSILKQWLCKILGAKQGTLERFSLDCRKGFVLVLVLVLVLLRPLVG